MNASRSIPGRPVQTGSTVARKISDLVADCLDASAEIDQVSVKTELAAAAPYLAQLVNAGHLANQSLVLIAAKLRLSVTCPVGEKAVNSTEDLLPARGAATADDWMLHIPAPPPYNEILRVLVDGSDHLTTAAAPLIIESADSGRNVVDLAALSRAAREE